MSVCAIAVLENEIVLASDGMAVNENREVVSLSSSKVHKFSHHTALLWMGSGRHHCGEEVLEAIHGVTDPKEAADLVCPILKEAYRDYEDFLNTQAPFWLLFLGFDAGVPDGWLVSSGNDPRYEPLHHPLEPGLVAAKGGSMEPEDINFIRWFAREWMIYKPDLEHAMKQAFPPVVEWMADVKGQSVGGNLYCERILPPL